MSFKARPMRVIDLTGKRFGRLTVIERASYYKNNQLVWVCRCDCGQLCDRVGNKLKTGDTKSCGCLNIDKIIQRRRLPEPWLVSFNYQLRSYKYRASRKGLVFELSREECLALFKGNCYYCGEEPSNIVNVYKKKDGSSNRTDIIDPSTADFASNGIDRVNNDIGYISDNCNSCCKTCNYTKIDISAEVWQAWVSRITEHKTTVPTNSSDPIVSVPLRERISKNKLLRSYKEGAKRRDLEFLLNEEDCIRIFKSNCHYCGVEPSTKINPYILKNGELSKTGENQNFTFEPTEATFIFNGIDRVDPDLGYLNMEQCVPCCNICNTGKMKMSYRDWKAYLARLAIYQKQKEVIT
jgi:hypothetical protein